MNKVDQVDQKLDSKSQSVQTNRHTDDTNCFTLPDDEVSYYPGKFCTTVITVYNVSLGAVLMALGTTPPPALSEVWTHTPPNESFVEYK